ncbi:hypothetical protein [Microbacterium timonense]|uniref:hypothetical protein n=1 Tax=Microbacterium timonense TaxID=2086576 RepID=UPI000D110D2A|nr:hypothetical protein [Microbacterium timonense]
MGEVDTTPGDGPADDAAPTAEKPRSLTPAMRRVLWGVGIVVALGLAVAIWLIATGAGSGTPDAADAGATPDPSATQGPIPGATPTTGSEVQPPEETAPPADRLPPLPSPSALVSDPLPASGSASGELVKDFPTDVAGPMPDSQVLESSIATEGSTMQVTLVARTDASVDEVRTHYRELWAGLGLADASGGDGVLTYSDTLSSLSLAFSPSSGTGTVYMIYGVLRTS